MKTNLINLWAVQVNGKTTDYKTENGAKKAYENAKQNLQMGETVRLIQYTDVIGNVEELEFYI